MDSPTHPVDDLSVAIISSSVGQTPDDLIYPFVFDEAYNLAKRGINVHVARSKVEPDFISCGMYYHGLKKKKDISVLNTIIKNCFTYPYDAFLRNPKGFYSENLYAKAVSQTVKNFDIDLIHAHFAYPEGLVGLLAKNMTEKPLIVTVHGYDILVESSVGYGIRLNRSLDAIVRRVLNRADAVMAGSQATFQEVNKLVSNKNNVHFVPNSVDINKFNPHLEFSYLLERLNAKEQKIVFALRAHEPKYGLEYLIKAASIVTKERNDVLFVIAGDGSLRQYHEQLAAKLSMENKIIFPGRISQEDAPHYFAMCDISVVPSVQEAFGLVVSEAMACGKPVIGTNVGGIPDQIIDNYNGFLVSPKSPTEIAEKIIYLVDNPEEKNRMGLNGREFVKKNFSLEKRIEKIAKLYETLK